jgi:hypothetical protein
MATGTINLTFETPDLTLTGSGDYDISETFKAVFTENPSIQKEIADKIENIFNRIKTKDIADEWENKIKKALKIDKDSINIQTLLEKKAKEIIGKLKFDTSGVSIAPKTTGAGAGALSRSSVTNTGSANLMANKDFERFIKFFTLDKNFQNFIKFFTLDKPFQSFIKNFSIDILKIDKSIKIIDKSISTFSKKIDEIVEKINSSSEQTSARSSESADSVFEQTLDVNVVDISDQTIYKLKSIFGDMNNKTVKRKGSSSLEGEELESPKKGFLASLLGGMFAGKALPSFLSKLVGPALLAGGLVWMAMDGIKGWMKAEEWGTSKISAGLGGLLGGLSSGMEGAFKNAGKWALVGAGLGTMIVPIVGTLIGGILGAAVGAILGWIGGEALAKKFDKLGEWFKSSVLPELEKIWTSIKRWWNEGLKPAIGEFAKKVMPILKDFGIWLKENVLPILKRVWEGIKWIGALLGDVLIWVFKNGDWIVAGILDVIKKLWNAFVKLGEWLGIAAFYTWEALKALWKGIKVLWNILDTIAHKFIAFGKAVGEGAWLILNFLTKTFKWIKDKFIAFGKAIGEGASLIVDWVINKWNDTVDAFKNGFKKFFDWIVNLGDSIKNGILSILPERMQKWIKGDKIENDTSSPKPETKPVKTKAAIITYQPANEDRLYRSGSTDIYAKPDDILGKTFKNVEKQLTLLNDKFNKMVSVLDEHTKLFANIANINQQQLGFLPSLVPIQEKNEKRIPNTDVRDPAYEYRTKIYERLERGV